MSSREGSPTAPSPWIVAGGAIFVVAMLVAVTDVVRAGDAVEHTGGLGIAVLLTSGIGAAAGTIIAGAGLLLFALRKTKAPRVLTARAIPAGLIALGAWPMIDALTSGPWISSQAWVGVLRWGAVLLAFVGGCIGARLADLAREGADHRRRYLLAMSLACLALDILAFPNQYAAFHQGLAVAFVILAAMTGIGLAEHTRRIAVAVAPIGLVGGLIALGLVATDRLPGDDAAHRQFLRRDAPWCTRLLTLRPDAPTDVDIATGDVIARLLPTPDPVDPGVLDTMLPVRRDANIVFITLDAVRPDHLGCYGYVRRPSPELDAFAALCTVFERCWAQYPSSQLSLASMFQSLYPSATDVAGRRNQPNELQQPQSMPPLALRLRNAGRRTVAVSALKRRFVADIFPFLREGFDRFNEFPTPDNLDGTEVTKHTLDELRLLTGDQPWFLWSHYFDPHHPYRPHPDGPGFGGGVSGLYDGEIHHMDRQLGVALRALQKRDDWSRTIVVIHADHGEELLDHGGSYHNSSLYEEQVRVPLLIRIPGVSGHRVPSIVELVDVVPTLLELMGQEIPEGLQGHSLLRVILPQSLTNDGGQAPPAAGFTQFREPASLSPRQDAVCIGDDKLVHHISSDTYELFDLDQDEGEQKNRALQTTDTL
ncbi:MAG: hypothetical protein CMJ83_18430, partial [Planctomycetes bacterium]|nr:hypothetical protein [Planctomycetota bacterium]